MASMTAMPSRVGGNRSAMARGSGKRVAFRHVEWQAVGEDAARVQQRNGAVVQRFRIQLHARQAVRTRTRAKTVANWMESSK